MAVVPAFIKFFSKVISFDFSLILPAVATPITSKVDKEAQTKEPEKEHPLETNNAAMLSPAMHVAGSRESMGMWLGEGGKHSSVRRVDEWSLSLHRCRPELCSPPYA